MRIGNSLRAGVWEQGVMWQYRRAESEWCYVTGKIDDSGRSGKWLCEAE